MRYRADSNGTGRQGGWIVLLRGQSSHGSSLVGLTSRRGIVGAAGECRFRIAATG